MEKKQLSYFVLAAFFFSLFLLSTPSDVYGKKGYPSPDRFEKAIKNFEKADKKKAPPQGAILCIGSSSMGGWHKHIAEDLSPLTVIKRGFGGSNMNDALHFADRVVIPYKPRAILLYEGDNDIAQGISPQEILQTFGAFVKKVRKALPKVRIYVLSIKPSPSRWRMWGRMMQANSLLGRVCARYSFLTYIDIATPMLNSSGKPKGDIFLSDKLHMNREGYLIWKKAVRSVLVKKELKYEKK